MFNPIESYEHAGMMAGKAARNHDMGMLNHWANWKRAAVRLETPEDKALAEKAYTEAYTNYARG
jgi:hypothetical protein